MATLTENLTEIKRQKDTYILPENIKKDVTVFGVTGTLESGGIATSGAKIFETQEEMQNDTTAQEGDLAVVYRSETQNATVDSKFQVATFPETVVLDTALTDHVEVRYRAVDSSKMFDCWGSLDSSSFRMNCYTETEEVRIEYTSSNGITYTRTDTTGNPVDFGTEIYYERTDRWNDVIGKFIQIGGNVFDGLYECKSTVVTDTYVLKGIKYHLPEFSMNLFNSEIRYEHACVVLNTVTDGNEVTDYTIYNLYNDGTKFYLDGNNLMSNNTNAGTSANIVKIHYTNGETKREVLPSTSGSASAPTSINLGETYNAEITVFINCDLYSNISASNVLVNSDDTFSKVYSLTYNIAPTQLSVTPDYVYEKEFYGKNGIETGTLGTPDNSFADTNAEVYSKIQNYYDNLEPRVLTDGDKTIDKNIYFIPVKKDGTVLLDTSKVTNMEDMFYNCKSLTTISLLNTSKVTNMNSMFQNCTSLTEIPLLNTSNVTNMESMFANCTNLAEIPLLDTSKVTDMKYMFYNCTNLVEIPLLNTSSVTYMNNMFNRCTNLTTISLLDTSKVTNMGAMFANCTNLTEIPLLDTSKVTDMISMFANCISLTTIPLLDTSKVTSITGMDSMFVDCTSLSDESLNNILAMCKNATSYTGTKTLAYIGLSEEQATKCTTLSNYSAFTSAGWTTGY